MDLPRLGGSFFVSILLKTKKIKKERAGQNRPEREKTMYETKSTSHNLNSASEAAERMCKKFGTHRVAEEVAHLTNLVYLAEQDKQAMKNYAVSEDENSFQDLQQERLALQYKNMAEFAAKEICRHASLVKKVTGIFVLERRYDVSRIRECEALFEDIKTYFTYVGIECYLKMAR